MVPTRPNSIFVHSRPWATSPLVLSSLPYWKSSSTRIPCSNGNDTAKSQLVFLTSPRYWNSSIFELKLQSRPSPLTRVLLKVGIPTEEVISPLRPSLPTQRIHPPIVSYVAQASIHSTPARPSSLSLWRKCYLHYGITTTVNFLKPGHFVRECKSLHRCRKCQKPHHSLLYVEPRGFPTYSTTPSTFITTSHIKSRCWSSLQFPLDDMLGSRPCSQWIRFEHS